MKQLEIVKRELLKEPKIWLITGCAGFIGSNLLQTLLHLDQTVVGLDNFSTGYRRNLDDVKEAVSAERWGKFTFIEGDIRDLSTCRHAVQGVNYVLHQAALGSVPRSLKDPVTTNTVNIDGFLNMLIASRDAQISSFVYAASSSTYGDHPGLPKIEERIGRPLSPYAVTKYVNELYAEVFARSYGFKSIGLRYFNVFGKRQDPEGAYAAVIPRWIATMLDNGVITINGDGETSRDFCYVDNVVQANLLAATASEDNKDEVYNVAVGEITSLNRLTEMLESVLRSNGVLYTGAKRHAGFREGDIRHSQASIEKISKQLGYSPEYRIGDGLVEVMPWYIGRYAASGIS